MEGVKMAKPGGKWDRRKNTIDDLADIVKKILRDLGGGTGEPPQYGAFEVSQIYAGEFPGGFPESRSPRETGALSAGF